MTTLADISNRRHQIEKDRRLKQKELMNEYDTTIFYPARKQINEDCAAIGHGNTAISDNGLGWAFETCCACGMIVRKYGPNNQVIEC